jgi:hypothetical protein
VFITILRLTYFAIFNDTGDAEVTDSYHGDFSNLLKHFGKIVFLLYGCLIGPLLEETSFRLGFSFRRRDVLAGLLALIVLLSAFTGSLYAAATVGGLLMAATAYLFTTYVQQVHLDSLKLRYGKLLMHAMAFLFMIIHLSNYGTYSVSHIASYVFSLLIILAACYMLYYVRIRAGFFYGVAFHGLLNLFMLSYYLH